MIAVDKTLLENTFLLEEAKQLKQKNFISKVVLDTIENELPTLKHQNNLLVRFGFFLLGSFLYSSITGMLSLVFMETFQSNYELTLFINAIVGFVGCEFFSRMKFRSFGLDDAFVLGSQIAFVVAFGVSFESILVVFIAMTIISLICCIRYVNTFSALFFCIGITGFLCTLIIEHHVIDLLYLPFVLLFLAIGLYMVFIKLKTVSSIYFYKNSLKVIQIFSLVLGYFSVNYLVVRQLSEELMNLVIDSNNDIPFAFLFYGFTFIIPIFYILLSLKNKDKAMLYIGFLTLCFSVFTIRYYYSLMPVETALILAGILLFVFSISIIKLLKNKEDGITFKPDYGNNENELTDTESLLTNSQIDVNPVEHIDQNMPFGGGDFSGGGSGGSF